MQEAGFQATNAFTGKDFAVISFFLFLKNVSLGNKHSSHVYREIEKLVYVVSEGTSLLFNLDQYKMLGDRSYEQQFFKMVAWTHLAKGMAFSADNSLLLAQNLSGSHQLRKDSYSLCLCIFTCHAKSDGQTVSVPKKALRWSKSFWGCLAICWI